MAWFRRTPPAPTLDPTELARLVSAELKKQMDVPPGSQVYNENESRSRALATVNRQRFDPRDIRMVQPLPRTEPPVAFGPGEPMFPAAIDPLSPSGRPMPRFWDYPESWNLYLGAQKEVPFQVLRQMSDRCSIQRRCIEINKNSMTAFEWNVTLSPAYVDSIMLQTGEVNQARAAALGRTKFQEDIDRIKSFWEKPDAPNKMTWSEWILEAIEEERVIDALAIYPHLTIGGVIDRAKGRLNSPHDLVAFEILDGSTIKPLLDHRGGVPQPPDPAYQQILKGFWRGEFQASDSPDGEFKYDQLFYRPRNRRTWTPYGYSPTEQSLVAADIWMRREEWIRSEYTSGVVNDMIIESDLPSLTAEQLKQYERVWNEEMAGQTDQRRGARMLGAGMKAILPDAIEAKYRPEYDEFLIKQIGAKYGIMPTQLGVIPRVGMAGRGTQAGEADLAETMTDKPYQEWVVDVMNELSILYLQMPKELTFSFSGNEIVEDALVKANRQTEQVGGGLRTLNDIRAENGEPLFDFPEADMPFIAQGGFITWLEGASTAPVVQPGFGGGGGQPHVGQNADQGGGSGNPRPPNNQNNPKGNSGTAAAEAQKFARFCSNRDGESWRDFAFSSVDSTIATRLNAAGRAGDMAAVADLVKAVVASPKAPPTAADQLAGVGGGQGLPAMLAEAGIAIKDMTEGQVAQIGQILGDGVRDGWTGDMLASQLEPIVGDADRSLLIANTEVARARSLATIDQYRADNIAKDAWLTVGPEACPVCRANEAHGSVPAGDHFPSGDAGPPAHPHCRCTLIPVFTERTPNGSQ